MGIPVLVTAVGGRARGAGPGAGRRLPGLLVPPDDPAALAGALRRWLGDADLRDAAAAVRGRSGGRRCRLGGRRPNWSGVSLAEVAA